MSNQDYNIKTVLGIYKNKVSINKDTFVGLELVNKTRLTEQDKNVHIVNNVDRFNYERNTSGKYRINGRLEIVTGNVNSFAFNYFPAESDWNLEELDTNQITKNWIIQLTYPYSNDVTTDIITSTSTGVKTSKPDKGVQILSMTPVDYTGRRTKVLLRTVQKHGILNVGEFIYITPDNGILNYLGFHKVLDFEFGNEERGLILETPYEGTIDIGNVKRVFEPSTNDTLYLDAISLVQISKCDSQGTTIGALNHTKIYDTNHGLRLGDYIDLRFNSLSPINGIHKVVAIPNSNEFVIRYELPFANVGPVNITDLSATAELRYRRIDGTPSDYYFRKFKILTDLKDYEIYKAAYSVNIFSDEFTNKLSLFHFNKNVDVTDLRDNLNRPLSELYLTVTRRSNPFSDVISISEENSSLVPISSSDGPIVLETLSYWTTNGVGSIQRPNSGDTLYGDFVEYNSSFLQENVLSKVVNRFGVSRYNSTSNTYYDNGDGYYYLPHNKIQIRKYSTTIETVDNKPDEEYPEYAQLNNNGTVSWRDLLDIGFYDTVTNGVDYPFVNGCHYLYDNYTIYIRRQLQPNLNDVRIRETDFVKVNNLDGNGLGEKC